VYELVRCGEMSFYLDAPVKSGIVLSGAGDIVLIDSGGDKDAGKKILKILESNGWRLSFIVNTHSNADHIGGNAFLQKRTGCRIFGSGMENAFIRFPVLEPSFLFGGFPCRELRNKFLTASESVPEDISGAPLPPGTEILPLKGHFFDMIGLKTPDGICFAADALFSENVLRKYGTPFIYDVRAFLETLDMFEGLEARLFVPAHAEAVEDIRPLVGANRRKVNETAEKIQEICRSPCSSEDVLKSVFDAYGLSMDFNSYVLVGSTVRSYLSFLHDDGRLRTFFEGNRLFWQTV
jgi:glyoxylase-like metal-dependent hydrolase (beta-lactamase superfamily II)